MSATPFIRGCAAVETSSGVEQQGLLLATLAAHQACRTLGAAGGKYEDPGVLGTLGLWAPGALRMAGIRVPSSRTCGL